MRRIALIWDRNLIERIERVVDEGSDKLGVEAGIS